jgi:hypothetical protein
VNRPATRSAGFRPNRRLRQLGTAQTATAAPESLRTQAAEHLHTAEKLIAACGYRRRDAELAELQAVLHGINPFSALPPRV